MKIIYGTKGLEFYYLVSIAFTEIVFEYVFNVNRISSYQKDIKIL